MSIERVANQLVKLCREGRWEEAQKTLYHKDIISKEPEETGGDQTQGLDNILKKNESWDAMVKENHGWSVSDPMIADGYFSCTMTMDVTLHEGGRIKSTELCVYKVVDDKIVSEMFFHN